MHSGRSSVYLQAARNTQSCCLVFDRILMSSRLQDFRLSCAFLCILFQVYSVA